MEASSSSEILTPAGCAWATSTAPTRNLVKAGRSQRRRHRTGTTDPLISPASGDPRLLQLHALMHLMHTCALAHSTC